MHLALDILLISVFAMFVFLGWRRGLFKTVCSVGRLILALAVTFLFGSAFGRWLDGRMINTRVYASVSETFSNAADDVTATAEGGVDALVERIPEAFRGYLDLTAIDPAAEIHELAEQWSRTVADGISRVISSVLGHLLLFALAFIALTAVIFLVRGLVRLPVIRTVDQLLGMALGAVSGMLAVFFISVILGAFLGALGQGDVAEGSAVLRLFSGAKDLILQ
jgi:uncharacterized membrane protein required for colicin V production